MFCWREPRTPEQVAEAVNLRLGGRLRVVNDSPRIAGDDYSMRFYGMRVGSRRIVAVSVEYQGEQANMSFPAGLDAETITNHLKIFLTK